MYPLGYSHLLNGMSRSLVSIRMHMHGHMLGRRQNPMPLKESAPTHYASQGSPGQPCLSLLHLAAHSAQRQRERERERAATHASKRFPA